MKTMSYHLLKIIDNGVKKDNNNKQNHLMNERKDSLFQNEVNPMA